jgi:hypothetical protein
VQVDGNLITGQNPASSVEAADKRLQILAAATSNVWSAGLLQAKSEDDGLVCANVYGLDWSGFLRALMECAALRSYIKIQSCGLFARSGFESAGFDR